MKLKFLIITAGMFFCGCSNEELKEVNSLKAITSGDSIPKAITATKIVPETINRTNLSTFNGWENVPVYIISESNSENKYLTLRKKRDDLIFAPFNDKINQLNQKFYIKLFRNYIELHGYPDSENDRYGIHVFGSGKDYDTFQIIPDRVTTSKWKLWDVNNGVNGNYILEALSPSAYLNSNEYPIQGVMTANNSNVQDNKVYFSVYNKESFQRFKIFPAEDFDFIDIDYDTDLAKTLQKPDFTAEGIVSNETSINQNLVMKFSRKATNSSSWMVGTGISATVGFEAEVGVPLLASGTFSFSSTISASANYGKTSSTEDLREYSFDVTAPPNSVVKGIVSVKQYTADINYRARVRGKKSGRIIEIRGVWTGVASDQITYKITEIKPMK